MTKQRGYIYVVKSPNTNKVYVGSTTKSITSRKKWHKRNTIDKEYVAKIYDAGDAYVEQLEEVLYDDIDELIEREAYHIRAHGCLTVNVNLTGSSKTCVCGNCNTKDRRPNYYNRARTIIINNYYIGQIMDAML